MNWIQNVEWTKCNSIRPISILTGTYSLSITYKEEHIPGSPFKIKVEGESILAYTLTSKVEIKVKLKLAFTYSYE